MAALAAAEEKILSGLGDTLEPEISFVPIDFKDSRLRTIALNVQSSSVPLVLIHGMGSGIGLWVLNLPALATTRPVYAFDVLGFGRSSRPKFSENHTQCEMEFVQFIEEWRQGVNLEKFVLLGHSFGGYLASLYAMQHAERVKHLILVDPWGFTEKPPDSELRRQMPWWVHGVAKFVSLFNPFAVFRAAGPLGTRMVKRFRPDFKEMFEQLFDDDTVTDYIYHCNTQSPSGEIAFKTLADRLAWAKLPLINRIKDLPEFVPITVIVGSESWMSSDVGWHIKHIRENSFVDVQVIRGAGHHVYADYPGMFNLLVNRACENVDQEGKETD